MAGTDGYKSNWRFHHRAKGELAGLQLAGRAALLEAIRLYGKGEALSHHVKPLRTDLLELRVRVGNDPFRLIFFHPMPFVAVGLVAFYKNSPKTPNNLIDTAQERRGAWIAGSGSAT